MNRIEFQQAGGFPLETDTLNFLQNSLAALQALCALGGDNYILSGCITTGANTSDGFVVINSEVLPFRGGLNQTNVVIRESITKRNFENGSTKDVFFERYATFGTGAGAIAFDSLTSLKNLKTFRNLPHVASSDINSSSETTLATSKAVKAVYDALKNQVFPGVIVMWSGSVLTIPGGWALCDGQNGRPNLRNAFIVGAGDQYSVGAVGGEAKHQLTISELPRHRFEVSGIPVGQEYSADRGNQRNSKDATTAYTNYLGDDLPHNNLPPYFALAYIIKL